MSQNHINGLMAVLEGANLTVYDTEVPADPSFPYVLLTAPNLRTVASTLDDAPIDVDDSYQLTGAGTGVEQARWVMAKAYLALDRSKPDVDGFNTDTWRIGTRPLMSDNDVNLTGGGHPIFGTDTYRYRATPNTEESS